MTITETEPTIEVGTLTKDDLFALRTADGTSFHKWKNDEGVVIRCYLRHASNGRTFSHREQLVFPEPHTGTERMRTIYVTGSVSGYAYADYADPENHHYSNWLGDASSTAFVSGGGRYDRTWTTIAQCLRVGDVVSLAFLGDHHSNGYVKVAGLHADSCELRVTRGGNRQALVFEVATTVTPSNSARMVQQYS